MRGSGPGGYQPLARTAVARYSAAVALGVTAAVLSRVFLPVADGPPYALLVGAVAVAVWYGGFGPGLLAVVTGWTLSPLLTRSEGFAFEEPSDVRWAVSLAVALVVVWVSLVMRRGQQRAATAAVAAEESTRNMELLRELATALSAAPTPTEVAHELVDRLPTLMGARGGALGLIDGDDLVITDPAGVESQTHRPGLRLPLEARAPITRAAAEGRLQRVETRADFEERFPDGAALTPYAQAALAVPLRAGGEIVGSFSCLFDKPRPSEEADAIALIAADLGGRTLERARFYEQERQSRRALDRILRVTPRFYAGKPEEVSTAICREARRSFGADLAALWRVGGDRLHLVSAEPLLEPLAHGLGAILEDFPGLLDAVGNLDTSFVADIQQEARAEGLERARRLGIHSTLRTPIVIEGRAELVLIVSWFSVVTEPDAATMAVARRFADQAGLALEQLERREAEEEAARRAAETRRLLDTTAALAAAATPTEVTAATLEEGLRSLGAFAGVVACRTEEGGALEIVDSRGYKQATLERWHQVELDARVPLAEAARKNRTIAIQSLDELERDFPSFARARVEQSGAWLVVPLSAAGSVIGAAGFSFSEPRTFSKEDLEFAEALARQSGQALERALLLATEYAARTRAEDMVVLASALSQALSPTDVAHAVGAQVLSMVSADLAAVYILDDASNLELVDVVGRSIGAGTSALKLIPLGSASPLAEAARNRESVWLEAGDDWSSLQAQSWQELGLSTLGAFPLAVNGRLLGVLVVGFGGESPVGENARRLMHSIARQSVQPLERAWLMEREQAARIDAETASRRTRRLQSITQTLAAAAAPRDVAAIVVRETIGAVSGDAAALLVFDGDREAPRVLAEVELGEAALVQTLTAALVPAALSGSLLVIDAESPAGMQESVVRTAIADAGFSSAVSVPLGVGTRVLGSLLVCFRSRDRLPEEDAALLQALARIGAQALERSRLFDDEQRLRQRAERLQQTTALLSGSLTQRDVAEVVVDALVQGAGADGAALSVVVEERQLQKKLLWRGYQDEVQEAWQEVPLSAATPGNRALKTRALVFYETLEALGRDFPEAVEGMRGTGHESFLFVPLVAGGSTNGLVITSWAERITLSDEDRVYIETLASQAAQALDRSRHFESERTIAETLQRSVLPVSLPTVESVQLAARYLPGTEEVDVGGDWFDAIHLPNGRLGLAVGDVVGKGVQSAATMAQLRNALRAFALEQMKPSSTIARLNRLTDEVSDSAFATVVYAVLDPEAGICRMTSAGHPPPLLLYPDGHAEYVEGGRGLPLGTGSASRYRQHVVEMPVGSTLVLYTDGLIERRSESIDVGLETLKRAAGESSGNPELLVEHVLDRLVGRGARGDDIAVLAVRLLAVPPKPLEMSLPRDRRSLDLVRDALRIWLQHGPASQSEAHEIVLATWEACANAVEHPHGVANGSFGILAELADSRVCVSISDSGRWLPETKRPDRGLGLRLIRAVMSSVDVEVTEEGTLVRLEKELAGDAVASVRKAR